MGGGGHEGLPPHVKHHDRDTHVLSSETEWVLFANVISQYCGAARSVSARVNQPLTEPGTREVSRGVFGNSTDNGDVVCIAANLSEANQLLALTDHSASPGLQGGVIDC
ncbi:MAG: hypothetical protein ACFFGZ_07225 [Candidatus Thorarchaeota archaeon]